MAAEGSTVLGKSITVRGEIIGSEDLSIDGVVSGTITLPVHDAVILGRCEGSTTATGRVELRKGSSLVGDLTAARLSIEEGAMYQGKVALTGNAQ